MIYIKTRTNIGNRILLNFSILFMDMNAILSQDFNAHVPLSLSSVPQEEAHHQKSRKKRTKFQSGRSGGVLIQTPRPRNATRKPPDPAASGETKITRPCTECGKKFWSWKALFGHMRCHPERQWRGINPPTNLQWRAEAENEHDQEETLVWTEEDNEVATWLLIMANGPAADQPPSAQRPSENRSSRVDDGHEEDVVGLSPSSSVVAARFECSSCKKVFASHQALGGHRASHKNVKGCYAITKNDGENESGGCCSAAIKLQDCAGSKCSRHFSNGQQLGDDMRRRHRQRETPICCWWV